MISKSLITLSLIGIVFLGGIIIYFLMFIANRNFYTICDLYKNKFGNLPLSTELFYTSSPFFLAGYNKKSKYSENINDVEFIRSLPKKLTRIYVINYYFSIIISCFFCMLAAMLYVIK